MQIKSIYKIVITFILCIYSSESFIVFTFECFIQIFKDCASRQCWL